MIHNIELGTLVEITGEESESCVGVRLFVVYRGRDCDMTPLYWLSPYTPEEEDELGELYKRHRIGGYGEENLQVIRAAQHGMNPTAPRMGGKNE